MADKPAQTPVLSERPEDFYLYLLVRTDMVSLGRGKSVAQGAHAANEFVDFAIVQPLLNGQAPNADAMAWRSQAGTYGTTIALDAKLKAAEQAILFAKYAGFQASFTKDPSYPLLDGETLHILPDLPTVGWIFGRKNDLRPILQRFKLLENDAVPWWREKTGDNE